MLSRHQLLDRHLYLSDELAAVLRERGDLNAEIIKVRTATWREYDDLRTLGEREWKCKEATHVFDSEAAKMTGDIDAYRVELD